MNLYQNLYDLINQYIFNDSIVSGSFQDLWVVCFSMIGVFLLVLIPIWVVIGTIKKLLNL